IHRELGVKLTLKELFAETTIEQQSTIIAGKELKAYEIIEAIPQLPAYKLSSSQRRLWILNHFEGAQSAYNIPYVLLLEGQLDISALKKAFQVMAGRHEILRTVFIEDKDGTPKQQVLNEDAHAFNLKETD